MKQEITILIETDADPALVLEAAEDATVEIIKTLRDHDHQARLIEDPSVS